METKDLVKQLQNILDSLVKANKTDNDSKEVVYDTELAKIKDFPKENIIEALKKAIGTNSKRKQVSVFIFAELYEIPNIDEAFTELLHSADEITRSVIIQTVGLKKLKQFIPLLNKRFETETHSFCKDQLLFTLGEFADDSSLSIFLKLAKPFQSEYKWRLACAFKNFAKQEGRPYLEKIFNDNNTDKSEKIIAAWGLVKIGDKNYFNYLLEMLNDPDITTNKSFTPGQSLRAAQAICDINNWEFTWNNDYVAIVKERIKKQQLT